MSDLRWNEILLRMSRQDAEDIDEIAGTFDPRRRPPGDEVFPTTDAVLMPQTKMKQETAVFVGLRVTAELPDAVDQATRLAAFAGERDVGIIVLAQCDLSGLERFGFRVERIGGGDADALEICEDQVRRFWNIDLLL